MPNKLNFKNALPYIVAIATFVVLTFAYCAPMLQGKVVSQSDNLGWMGMSQEVRSFAEETGHRSYWTNSMFGGMPTYQISFPLESQKPIKFLRKVYQLFMKYNVWANFIVYFFGFFILLRAFKTNKWLSIIGSIAITFSTYFLIIIAAGHTNKVFAIGYMAPVIAGFIYIFQKRYLLGACLTMLFTSFGMILHPQMAYYFMLMLGIFGIAELYIHIKNNKLKDLSIGVAIFAASVGIGLGTGYSNIKSNSEYVKETMRGGHSEIRTTDDNKQMKGLDFNYATSWSYGIGETFTLLIPNFNGGATGYNVGTNSNLYKGLTQQGVPSNSAKQFCQHLPMYWGTQPFTEGPVYVGAIVIFLFLLGAIIVKGPYKWALLAATIFSILLSWGRNFESLSMLFFNYFPMYNKFRAVSSILVVAEVAMPILGIMAIQQIIDKKIETPKLLKSITVAGIATGSIALFFALFGGGMFDFTSPNDGNYFSQLPEQFYQLIIDERAHMLTSDAFRSLIFIVLGFAVLYAFAKTKINSKVMLLSLGVLIIADLWPVNKRYFGDDRFVNKKDNKGYFAKQPYETQILKDTDPNFRVFNLTTNTFNDSRTSYHLKSIGGYHASKLRRYQDLIEQHLSKGNMSVYNMLNTKYFIQNGEKGPTPTLNQDAQGNCWFADTLFIKNSPAAECDALNYIDTKNSIVVDTTKGKFTNLVKNFNPIHDSTATIKLTKYTPDELDYTSNSSVNKTAVFSEIYYPYGWKAYIDGNPAEIFRVNYVLRALNIPAGEHQIKFIFRPDSIYKGDKIATIFVIIMIGFVGFCIGWSIYQKRKENCVVANTDKED